MKTTLEIRYNSVLDEVNKTTAYETSKIVGEDGNRDAYERVSTVDADEEMLRRFYREAQSALLNLLSPFVIDYKTYVVTGYDNVEDEEITTPGLSIRLQITERTPLYGLGTAAMGYFVTHIAGEWYAMCHMPKLAEEMVESEKKHFEEVENIIYNKQAPKRYEKRD